MLDFKWGGGKSFNYKITIILKIFNRKGCKS